MLLINIQKLIRIFTVFLFITLISIGINAQDLKGQWKLVEMRVDGATFSLTDQNTPTLIFDEGNRVSGNGGCNRYGTTYDLERKTIDFKPFVTTKMACADDKMNQQEGKYFIAFDKVERFKASKKSLTFTDRSKRNFLRFAPIS